MAHLFGSASARLHFVVAGTGKIHAFNAADPWALIFGGATIGGGFSLLPVTPAVLTLVPRSPLAPAAAWTGHETPFTDGNGYWAAFAPGLGSGTGRLVATGQNGSGDVIAAYSDDGGGTWTGLGAILGVGGFGYSVAWASALGLGVVVGSVPGGSVMAVSSDLIDWGVPFDPFGLVGQYVISVAVNSAGDTLVAIDTNGDIWTSSDGSAWSPQTSVLSGFAGLMVRYLNGKWYALGQSSINTIAVVADPSDLTTWTPLVIPALASGTGNDIGYWGGRLWLAGTTNSGETRVVSSGDNGATWRTETTPFDGTGFAYVVAGAGRTGFVGGLTTDGLYAVAERDELGAWLTENSPVAQGYGLLHVPLLGEVLGEMFLLGPEAPDAVASTDVTPAPLLLTPVLS